MDLADDSDLWHTATISAGWNGNWTRHINHKKKNYSVKFETEAIGGKMRIIAVAERNIQFLGGNIDVLWGRLF